VDDFFEGNLHAGISNIVLDPDAIDLGDGIFLRKTYAHLMAHFVMAFAPPPPGSFHPGPWKATHGNASFTADITTELCVPGNIQKRYPIAQTIAFMLRFGINPAASISAVANRSFASLKDVPDREAIIIPIETGRRHFPLSSENDIATADRLQWIKNYWSSTHELRQRHPEFALAAAAISTGQFVHNSALILVSLWAALEALFSPSTMELKFRVSSLIAAYLEPAGDGRHSLQKQISKLYDRRSSAAHGQPGFAAQDILDTFNLLRRVIT
jgi:hypothetical protein